MPRLTDHVHDSDDVDGMRAVARRRLRRRRKSLPGVAARVVGGVANTEEPPADPPAEDPPAEDAHCSLNNPAWDGSLFAECMVTSIRALWHDVNDLQSQPGKTDLEKGQAALLRSTRYVYVISWLLLLILLLVILRGLFGGSKQPNLPNIIVVTAPPAAT